MQEINKHKALILTETVFKEWLKASNQFNDKDNPGNIRAITRYNNSYSVFGFNKIRKFYSIYSILSHKHDLINFLNNHCLFEYFDVDVKLEENERTNEFWHNLYFIYKIEKDNVDELITLCKLQGMEINP